MKLYKIVLILLISLSSSTYGQKYSFKKEWPTLATIYLSGVFDGTSETLTHHYMEFYKVFPNANQQYWNPTYSWRKKYKDGNYNLEPKYLGSTSFLVWTTDGYHMLRFSRNMMIVGTFLLHPREKKNWKSHALDVFMHTSFYHMGFWTTHEIIFNRSKY